ncbi:predicted protein [Candida tropicalis MYA-3404]|uniref:Uncharacterized protein n=1 Tax=Candida tropicalis (strain ATCC MYA-3404 / T1) TaxID=294747 RepID=C5MBM3_CANTT|nr:predicted protein [Candida tropicalis MYA-3404]EER33040.1 predicted protein [Candida tropicalis MYA-3404]KAG4406869.1 hypothetical protein JTP64_004253 [Candida tropicalis]
MISPPLKQHKKNKKAASIVNLRLYYVGLPNTHKIKIRKKKYFLRLCDKCRSPFSPNGEFSDDISDHAFSIMSSIYFIFLSTRLFACMRDGVIDNTQEIFPQEYFFLDRILCNIHLLKILLYQL